MVLCWKQVSHIGVQSVLFWRNMLQLHCKVLVQEMGFISPSRTYLRQAFKCNGEHTQRELEWETRITQEIK